MKLINFCLREGETQYLRSTIRKVGTIVEVQLNS